MKGIKPSPALFVAVIALVAALAGTAVGGVAVTSLSSKDKKQVTKIAKKQGKKQAKKQIKKQEPGLNVNSAKSADTASAVNGQTIVPINHRSNEVTNAKLASLNGITIRVSCDSGDPDLESIDVVTRIPGGEISAISNDAGGTTGNASELVGASDDNFIPGDPFEAGPGNRFPSERQYTLTYSGPDDRNVTAVFVTEDSVGDSPCVVSGYAIG